MALQTSGPISLANIQGEFGGTDPINLSEYYRGGSYVPSTRTTSTTTKQPSSGWYANSNYNVAKTVDTKTVWNWFWNGSSISQSGASSITVSGWTYYRGSSYQTSTDSKTNTTTTNYQIRRQKTTYSTVNINTNIPSSGQISLSDFYGGTNS